MECKIAEKALGSMEATEIAKNMPLMEHIKSCPACLAKYNLILRMDKAMAKGADVPLSNDFEYAVWEKIKALETPVKKPLWNPGIFTLATAGALACMVFFVMISKNLNKQPQPAAVLAEAPEIKILAVRKTSVLKKETRTAALPAAAQKAMPAAPITAQAPSAAREELAAVIPVKDGENHGVPLNPFKQEKTAAATYNPAQVTALAPEKNNYTAASVSGELTKTYSEKENIKGDAEVLGNMIHPLNNESVLVKYRVNGAGYVIIIVYDRKGTAVRRLFSGNAQPGQYQLSWNGMDYTGHAVATVIYILYIKAPSYENKSKIGVIK